MSQFDRAFIRAYQETSAQQSPTNEQSSTPSTEADTASTPQVAETTPPHSPRRQISGFDRPLASASHSASASVSSESSHPAPPKQYKSAPTPHLAQMQSVAAKMAENQARDASLAAQGSQPGRESGLQEPRQTNPEIPQPEATPVDSTSPVAGAAVGFGGGTAAGRSVAGLRPSQRVNIQSPPPQTNGYDPFQAPASYLARELPVDDIAESQEALQQAVQSTKPPVADTTTPDDVAQETTEASPLAHWVGDFSQFSDVTRSDDATQPSKTAVEESATDEGVADAESEPTSVQADAAASDRQSVMSSRLDATLASIDDLFSAPEMSSIESLDVDGQDAVSELKVVGVTAGEQNSAAEEFAAGEPQPPVAPMIFEPTDDIDNATPETATTKVAEKGKAIHRIDAAHAPLTELPDEEPEAEQSSEEDSTAPETLRMPVREFVTQWEVDHLNWPEIVEQLTALASQELHEACESVHQRAAIGQHIFALTGADEGVGCTTLTLCLAKQLAATGVKTAIIDANFDNPKIATQLRLGMEDGWEMTLLGETALENTGIISLAENLTVLPLSPKPGVNSTLANMTAAKHLGDLGEHFDVVLIDAGAGAENVAALTTTKDETLDAVTIILHDGSRESIAAAEDTVDHLTSVGLQDILIAENQISQAGVAG